MEKQANEHEKKKSIVKIELSFPEAIQGLEINSDHHRELPIDFESYQNWSLFHCHTINHCRK